MSIFLSPDDVAILTGIKRGRGGKTHHELQAEILRDMHIPFRVNAAGRVIVAIAAIEGLAQKKQTQESTKWTPNILRIHN